MSFIETIRQARGLLREEGRISLQALKREFSLDDEAAAEFVEELTDVQRVARLEGNVLVWSADAGAELPARNPQQYTPRHLAERILRSKSALEGERKLVTVLFADVKGSMELAEQIGAEAWHRVLDRFFEILSDGVHRFEGTVNQYTGDGIMALFGAPIAHEDHAQRACFAALHLRDGLRDYAQELRREHGLDLSARIGMNSGEVVVGKIGDDLRMDYTAQGHTVGLAQRMEQLAEPGRPYLARATADIVDGYFELEDLGDFNVKGASEPLRAYALEDIGPLRTRLDISQRRGFSAFVGRTDELEQLEATYERGASQHGQVVGIVAHAGTGKSRLCFELAKTVRARGGRVLEARCVAHGKLIPLLPIHELLRGFFGIDERDGSREIRQKIAGALLLLDREMDSALPLLFEFMGVPDPERPLPPTDPATRQREIAGVIRRVVKSDSERDAGALLIIEDLHWMDAESAVFLGHLVEAVSAGKGMLLLNFRPEFQVPWMKRSDYQQLPLEPLGADAVRELLDDLIGGDPSTQGLNTLIFDHTAGNPFFVEEVVRDLAEAGALGGSRGAYRLEQPVEDLGIPRSVEAVLAARIDRLPDREKHVIQTASVLGKEFPENLLREVIGVPDDDLRASLAALGDAELVFEQELFPEAIYAFAHPLTQAVAYSSQLSDARQQVHAAVARYLSKADDAQLDERSALLSHHYEGAGDMLAAASWARRCIEWTFRRGEIADGAIEGINLKFAELVERAPDCEAKRELQIQMLCGRCFSAMQGGADTRETLAGIEVARELADGVSNGWLRALTYVVEGMIGDQTPDHDYAISFQCFDQARSMLDPGERLPLPMLMGQLLVGRVREACEIGELFWKLLDQYRDLEISMLSPELIAHYYGCALAQTGRFADARDVLDQLEESGYEYDIDRGRFRTLLAELTGDLDGTAERSRKASSAMATFPEMAVARDAALELIAAASLMNGQFELCANACREALAIADRRGISRHIAISVQAILPEAELGLGNDASALRCADEIVARTERQSLRLAECRARLGRTRVRLACLGAEAHDTIADDIEKALALCERNDTPPWVPQLLEERARLEEAKGQAERAAQTRREALDRYRELGASGHVRRLVALG